MTTKSNLIPTELIENSVFAIFYFMINQHKHLLMDLKCFGSFDDYDTFRLNYCENVNV